MNNCQTTLDIISRIDPLDRHLLLDVLQRVSNQLGAVSYSITFNSPFPERSLYAQGEKGAKAFFTRFAKSEEEMAEESPVTLISGVK